MRIRTIKPEFWRSADVAALSIEDRLLFIGLWSYVDDYGVGRDEPQLIQCDLFPLDPLTEGSVRVHDGLTRIARRGLIIRYEGPDGRKYFQVVNWAKHQKINRKSKPVFPQYDAENCTLTESSLSPHDALTEGSLPEQGTGNREQGTGNPPFRPPAARADHDHEQTPGPAAPPADADEADPGTSKKAKSPAGKTRGTRIPEDWQPSPALVAWTREHAPAAATNAEVARFADYWRAIPGARGRKTDWAATWRNWARRAQEDHDARQRRAPAPGARSGSTTDDRVAAWIALADALPGPASAGAPQAAPLLAIEGGAA